MLKHKSGSAVTIHLFRGAGLKHTHVKPTASKAAPRGAADRGDIMAIFTTPLCRILTSSNAVGMALRGLAMTIGLAFLAAAPVLAG